MNPARARSWAALVFALSSSALAQQASDGVWADGRDHWALFEQKLVNRELSLQLDDRYRLGDHLGSFGPAAFAVASDLWVGAQVAGDPDNLTRFHGFFVGDLFGQARLGDWLDLDLNLTLLNPSASDGYRFSAFVLPGIALHLHHELFHLAGDALRFDFLAPDLDLVTTGEGLLVEQLPLEGYRGSLRWRDYEASIVFGGQAYFFDDDYTTVMLTGLGGRVGIQATLWDLPSRLDPKTGQPDPTSPTLDVYYAGAFGHFQPTPHTKLAAEVAGRFDGSMLRYGALLRADWLRRGFDRFDIHLGWQFRYYGKRFTPQALDETPHTSPSLPYREEAYITNAFEYFYLSREYDQWSHTGMAELRARVWRRLVAVVELEEFLRYVTDPDPLPRVAYASTTDRVPGIIPRIYYRVGVEWAFQAEGRFRGMLLFTNKTVNSEFDVTVPVNPRFSEAKLLLLRFVAKL